MTSVAVVIPFRYRGNDRNRIGNLRRVAMHWMTDRFWRVGIQDDGREGDAQFNRSAAYNRAVARLPEVDVFVFAEGDMLVDHAQVLEAVELAVEKPGLVVPFTTYKALGELDSKRVRTCRKEPQDCKPVYIKPDGRAIGCLNVVSRESIDLVGRWDESFEGSQYDDTAMRRAFEVCAGPTRWVTGDAYHLWHQPGWKGEHLTDEDRAATAANEARYQRYRDATTAEEIRALTMEGCGCSAASPS